MQLGRRACTHTQADRHARRQAGKQASTHVRAHAHANTHPPPNTNTCTHCMALMVAVFEGDEAVVGEELGVALLAV